ncbi:MAG: peptidase T [Defluviitaleaceae bacterium]|nr:peptidase T [Defluviitaleaceae bacterium]
MKTSVTEKFLSFIIHDTQSAYDAGVSPSTANQLEFAKVLVEECKSAGLSEVSVGEGGVVTATLHANIETDEIIGFLAHMDTSPDFSGNGVKPQIIYNYDGGDIALGGNLTLSPGEFPELRKYAGQTIITASGDTLLGADNKAGIAEILAAMEYLIRHPDIPHGKIRIAFTTDEEVGKGADLFDVAAFGADYAYTVDGGEIGELEYENFNAARVTFDITGKSVHPGHAKGIMINAGLIAAEIVSAFPADETPATTEGREGYYHLGSMTASVEKARIDYRIRDFDKKNFEYRMRFAEKLPDEFNLRYGKNTVRVEISEEYLNMKPKLDEFPHIIERARRAYAEAGVEINETPIRGGTDGSRLSYMGLPCPNIFTGGHNFHGPYEYIPAQSMEKAVEVIVNLCKKA